MDPKIAEPERPVVRAEEPWSAAQRQLSVLRYWLLAGVCFALAAGAATAAGFLARRALAAGDVFTARIAWLCGTALILVWLTLALAALDRPLVAAPPRWAARWLLKAGKRVLLVLQLGTLVIAGLVVVKWTLGLPVPWVP